MRRGTGRCWRCCWPLSRRCSCVPAPRPTYISDSARWGAVLRLISRVLLIFLPGSNHSRERNRRRRDRGRGYRAQFGGGISWGTEGSALVATSAGRRPKLRSPLSLDIPACGTSPVRAIGGASPHACIRMRQSNSFMVLPCHRLPARAGGRNCWPALFFA